MINSKFIRLFNSLSQIEIQDLKPFLSSPFFNTNPSIIKLYDALIESYPSIEKSNISKEQLFKIVYPKKKYNDNSFRNLILSFTKLMQEFLKQLEFKKRLALQDQLLLNALSNRNLKKDFNDFFLILLKQSKKNPPKDGTQFLEQYLILKEYYHFPETNRREMESDFPSKIISSLNHFFILSKLQFAIEAGSRNDLLAENNPTYFFKHFIEEYIETQPIKAKALLTILLLLENFYSAPTSKKVEQANSIFEKHFTKFSFFDSKMILMVLINQMNYLYRQGDATFLRKMYELYKFGIDENILVFNNSLTSLEYLNIVTTASRHKETAWALDFISSHKKYLPKNETELVKALAHATVHYDLGQFNKVTEVLSPYSFRKSPFGLRFRFISVKAYVELAFQNPDNLEFTETFILRMEQYIRRGAEKIKTDQSSGFSSFLKIVSAILKTCTNKNVKKIKEIKSLIEHTSPLIAKNWLLQKVADLEQL